MKKILVGMVVVLMASVAANAQEKDSSFHTTQQHSFRHHQHGMMAKQLNLSDEQNAQLKTLNTDYHKKMIEFKKNESMTVKDYKAGMLALRKDHKTQFESILTPAQKDQLAKFKKDRQHFGKKDLKTELGLTEAQAGQLKTLRTELHEKMHAIHTDSALTRDQKHEQVKHLAMQQKEELSKLLTPVQMQQLRQHRHQKDITK